MRQVGGDVGVERGGEEWEGEWTWAQILELPPAIEPSDFQLPPLSNRGVTWGDYKVR